jgi:hypothetical protein
MEGSRIAEGDKLISVHSELVPQRLKRLEFKDSDWP